MGMSFEEAHKKHEEDLKWIDDLYATGQISMLELSALKEQVDHEYRVNLSQAQ